MPVSQPNHHLSPEEAAKYTPKQVKIINYYRERLGPKYLSPDALCKEWIRDIATFNKKKVAVLGGNGSAKSTYLFKAFGRMIWTRPGMYLVTSGTTDQVGKLFKQKLRPVLRQMGMKREDNVRQVYEVQTQTGVATIHMKSNKTFESAEGIEYDAWIADEIQAHDQEAAEMYKKRTRKSLDDSMIRLTGLPDDPDSWLYEFIDRNEITLHEISLYDHPYQPFIDHYEKELKNLFPEGPKRDRYLYGKRVSLSGLGLFNISREHLGRVEYDRDEDLYFSFDFNVIYRAVSVWQLQGKDETGVPILGCIHSYRMKEDTTYQDGKWLANEWAGHDGRVFLQGDASGENRTATTSESMWQQVEAAFADVFEDRLRYIVPTKNPPLKDSIQVTNWALTNKNIIIDAENAARTYRSLSAIEADKYGEIDKSLDSSPQGANTHEGDAARYIIHYIFENYLPGRGDQATIEKIRGL